MKDRGHLFTLVVLTLLAALVAVFAALDALGQEHRHGMAKADADWYPKLKDPHGGSCCGAKDCRLSSYCSSDLVSEGVVIDGQCVPIPYEILVPPPRDVMLAPDEIHICAQRRAQGIRILCIVGGSGV